jgi:hypothetical protein
MLLALWEVRQRVMPMLIDRVYNVSKESKRREGIRRSGRQAGHLGKSKIGRRAVSVTEAKAGDRKDEPFPRRNA